VRVGYFFARYQISIGLIVVPASVPAGTVWRPYPCPSGFLPAGFRVFSTRCHLYARYAIVSVKQTMRFLDSPLRFSIFVRPGRPSGGPIVYSPGPWRGRFTLTAHAQQPDITKLQQRAINLPSKPSLARKINQRRGKIERNEKKKNTEN